MMARCEMKKEDAAMGEGKNGRDTTAVYSSFQPHIDSAIEE